MRDDFCAVVRTLCGTLATMESWTLRYFAQANPEGPTQGDSIADLGAVEVQDVVDSKGGLRTAFSATLELAMGAPPPRSIHYGLTPNGSSFRPEHQA